MQKINYENRKSYYSTSRWMLTNKKAVPYDTIRKELKRGAHPHTGHYGAAFRIGGSQFVIACTYLVRE